MEHFAISLIIFSLTLCITIVWGGINDNWKPFEKTKDLIIAIIQTVRKNR